jgi:hypothetical protein
METCVTFLGVLRYRALSEDHAQGEGWRRYGFDIIQSGPILGLSMRF